MPENHETWHGLMTWHQHDVVNILAELGSSGLQEAYTKACPNSAKKITAACWWHVMTPCQVSRFSGVFWI